MIIFPFANELDLKDIPPDLTVYYPVLYQEGLEIVCDMAFTSIAEMRVKHHWLHPSADILYDIYPKDVKIIECTLNEYMEVNRKKVRGGNPFATLNQVSFYIKWKRYWNIPYSPPQIGGT